MTYDLRVNTKPSLVSRAAAWVLPRARKASASLGRGWRAFKPVSLSIAGLGCFVAGAFTVSLLVGLLSAGAALFVAEWRVKG